MFDLYSKTKKLLMITSISGDETLNKKRLTLILFFFIQFAYGQKIDLHTRVDSLLQVGDPRKFNGTIIIAHDGKVEYSKSYGMADIKIKTPLKLEDQFIIGSISKEITAVLVLQEKDRGRLSLQDPITKYLTELKAPWADSITIHHLLNHTSGIISLNKPLAFKPGENFSYSPIVGYELLANVIEKTSGETYANLATDLFDNCNMPKTTIPELYNSQTEASKKLLNSYSEHRDGVLSQENYELKDIVFATSSGAIISTAKDLMNWNESLHKGKLLERKSYQAMTNISTMRSDHRWGEIGYGYGIQIDNQDDQLEYSHSGVLLGFISSNIYFPVSGISIIILENIAPDFDDMNRAFFFHDQVRKMIKSSSLLCEEER